MTDRRYTPAAGRVLSREEAYRVMEQQKQERLNPQPQEAPAANGQPEGNAETNEQPQLSAEELRVLEAQRAAVVNGTPAADQVGAPGAPIIIGQAPDGGPLRLDPGLVAQARMLMLGSAIGGVLVLIWWTRAQANRAPVAEEGDGK